MQEKDFWTDQEKARSAGRRLVVVKEQVHAWDALLADIEEIENLRALADKDTQKDIEDMLEECSERFSKLEFQTLFSGKYDINNALVALHAGTGGVDAMDWTEMLLRMYLRFCEKMGWRVKILDELRGGEAGIKTALFEVEGAYAYGYLKAEHGVHRLVRISPFNAEGLRQTSFALLEVTPDLGGIEDVAIAPEDIRVDVFRASGKGGQGVNTTDSAVRMTHIPTGIVVSCQNERSQLQNKETALRYLKAKLRQRAEQERQKEKKELRGAYSEAAWGNQIRSYVLNPYKLVKDHRTQYETQHVQDILDGNILPYIESYLRSQTKV
jgi:peptide chain release factor 2